MPKTADRSVSAFATDVRNTPVSVLRVYIQSVPEAELDALLRASGCAAPMGDFVVGETVASDSTGVATVELWDSAEAPDYRWPYRACLVQVAGGWNVRDIRAQCAGCFGSGFLDDELRLCDICDGGGWGVGLDVR